MDPEELDRHFVDVDAFYEAVPADRFRVLSSIAPDMTDHKADERLVRLDILIAGLQAADRRGQPLDEQQNVRSGAPQTARRSIGTGARSNLLTCTIA
jgi:hypothetical protein